MKLAVHTTEIFAVAVLLCLLTACDSTEPSDAPSVPRIIRSSDTAEVNQPVEVIVVSVGGEQAPLTIETDWGHDRGLESTSDVESGLYVPLTHRYFDPGSYRVRCRAIDARGRVSAWSQDVWLHIYGEAVVGRGDWWMYMHDAQHTGRSAYQGPQSPVLLWTYKTASPIQSSAAFDAFGHIYIGADDFRLHAILPDGRPRWQYWSGNARIQNAPAIARDGAVCFGGSSANVYRINRYGIKEWNTSTNAPIYTSNAAIDEEGNMYIGSEDGAVYSLTPDGTLRWQMKTNGPVHGGPALSPDETVVYFGSSDRLLYAADLHGKLRWTYPTSGAISGSPSVGPHGTIFFGSEDRQLYAVTSAGTLRWKKNLHALLNSTPAIGAEGRIYVAGSDGVLHCFDNEGNPVWNLPFTTSGSSSSPVLDVRETSYIADDNGWLYAISHTGKLLWKYDTEAPVYTTPAIGPNGVIVIGNEDGVLHALGEK